ncbi:Potassium voltage-gated channel subfamily KQT member 5 [Eumeta japonica]|uniref:Potassium voltage-gated channel subfamily KQT member 5 n=1 Tax=Eumeta variegata TaxID=151549 RepID=A0A4C1VRY0_EUMVA|nr:Potassium voltage-gated channel subfamily KQT member 5 [Eumeta japonica]
MCVARAYSECGRGPGGAGGRLAAPRMSLLGKPLSYRATRRDARYRRVQSKIYNFLERPRGIKAVLYHMIVEPKDINVVADRWTHINIKRAVSTTLRRDVPRKAASAGVRGSPNSYPPQKLFLMVFMCLALSVFSTIDEYEVKAGIVLFYMETVVVVWFAIEFFLRSGKRTGTTDSRTKP